MPVGGQGLDEGITEDLNGSVLPTVECVGSWVWPAGFSAGVGEANLKLSLQVK